MTGLWVALLDLALPQECAGCAVDGTRWCAACAEVLAQAAAEPLGRCSPRPCPVGFPPTAAAAPYDGPIRAALLAHKERGRLALVRPLAAALAAAVCCLDLAAGPITLVPAPSSRAAVRSRGQDHALRLARRTAHDLRRRGMDVRAAALLLPARALADQSGLDAAARATNLGGALLARGQLAGSTVVLVDDVVTSGATLVEAARALTAAGAVVSGAAVVAATQRLASAPRRLAATHSGSSPVHPAFRGLPSNPDPDTKGELRGHRRQGPERRSTGSLPGARRGEARPLRTS